MRTSRSRTPAKRLRRRRTERDLFFWTARRVLKLSRNLAVTVCIIVYVVHLMIGLVTGTIDAPQKLMDLIHEMILRLQ